MNILAVGTILQNRYRISKVIYSSPLANVYVVDDIHLPGNMWAVKEMKFLALDGVERLHAISQMKAEITRMAELTHPNLAKVIDFFVVGQNIYVLREFIPACDLEGLLKRNGGPFKERDVLTWGIQIADLLKYLVNKKFPAVFYKELDLTNILVTSEGIVKLIDLGLARVFQMETDPNKLNILGSSEYASPEQMDEWGVFDQVSLVYSLGTILFHIITNQNPTQTPFNLPPVDTLNPEVSSITCKIIRKATKKERNKRFASIDDMKKALFKALKILEASAEEKMNQEAETIELSNSRFRSVKPPEDPPQPHRQENTETKIALWIYLATVAGILTAGGILLLLYKIFFK